jgi:hypothetical protein
MWLLIKVTWQWRKLDLVSGGAEAYSQLIISNTPIYQFPK